MHACMRARLNEQDYMMYPYVYHMQEFIKHRKRNAYTAHFKGLVKFCMNKIGIVGKDVGINILSNKVFQ